jgi:hypothetical protein
VVERYVALKCDRSGNNTLDKKLEKRIKCWLHLREGLEVKEQKKTKGTLRYVEAAV